MKISIFWSGDLSGKLAHLLGKWLSDIMPWLRVHIPPAERYRGIGWFSDELKGFQDTEFAILSLTKENLHSPWLSFEAGALLKHLDRSSIYPVAVDLTIADVSGPLAQFQLVGMDKEGILKLIRAINQRSLETIRGGLEGEGLMKALEKSWPEFKSSIANAKPESPPQRIRSDRAVLYEILDLSRAIARTVESLKTPDMERLKDTCTKVKTPLPGSESLAKWADFAKELTDRKR